MDQEYALPYRSRYLDKDPAKASGGIISPRLPPFASCPWMCLGCPTSAYNPDSRAMMPPKKTKAEEAADFLSSLDNLDAPPSTESNPSVPATSESRASTDSARPRSTKSTTDLTASQDLGRAKTATPPPGQPDDHEANEALAFLQAQINTKRAPLSAPKSSAPRASTPQSTSTATAPAGATTSTNPPANIPTSLSGGGWGSSWWSSATSALQNAQKLADEGYKRVRTEGVAGVSEQLKGVDLNKLRQGAEERLGGIVKGVDLEKLREFTRSL